MKKPTNKTGLSAMEAKSIWSIPKKDLVPSTKIPKNIEYDRLRAIVDTNSAKINDVKGIMEILPDVALVGEVLVASILSPKDLTHTELNIRLHKDAPGGAGQVIMDHMNTVHDLDTKLPNILMESLFTIGSHVLVTLPVSSIGNLINDNNVALEDIGDTGTINNLHNIGLLKTNIQYGMEDIDTAISNPSKSIEITDNIQYLAGPTLDKIGDANSISQLLKTSYGLEGLVGDKELKSLYLKRKTKQVKNIEISKPSDKEVGVAGINPIIMNIPAESVIPVTIPGEPEEHVGYYIVLDKKGNPIVNSGKNNFKEMQDRLEASAAAKQQVTLVTTSLGVTNVKDDGLFNESLLDAYTNKLETELKAAVEEGITNQTVDIAAPEEIYRIMYARQLSNQGTRLVYIPAAMVTYIAFNYDELGIGISLVEKTKLYASLRAILMFAQLLAGIKNSVPGRTLTVTLDKDDPDPQGTLETVMTEYAALQNENGLIGKLEPTDIVDALQRSGVQVKIDGGDLFPNTGIEVDEKQTDVPMPDSDLSDSLRHMHYAGMGVSPETIDVSLEADFATGITANNLLQAKRVMLRQVTFTAHISDFIKKYIYAGGSLITELKELIDNDKGNDIDINELVDSIKVELPKSDTAMIRAQKESYDDYADFIETAVELFVSEDMIVDMLEGDTVPDSIESVRVAITSMLRRKYLRNQNMLPELERLFTDPDDSAGELVEQHNKELMEVVGDIYRAVRKKEHKEDKTTNKLIDRLENETDADTNPDVTPPADEGTIEPEEDL